jgi:pimeloyl-ACP methyl ester carboxylesterase
MPPPTRHRPPPSASPTRRRRPGPGLQRLTTCLGMLVALAAAPAAHADPTTPCRLPGIAHEVRCGQLQRPLDPAQPGGRQIQVHYLVLPAMARRKLPDPVVMLAGGPGQSAIQLAPSVLPLFSRLNNRRDIVFIDQRGTGRSAPLECEPPKPPSLADQLDGARQRAFLSACREALATLPHVQGADGLRFFTTTLAMQDVDAVRQALGAAQWNVVGGSYGTRAGLELLRQFPDRVRRLVLDGVAPPDMALPASMSTDAQAALDALLASCAAQPACEQAYPRLREQWTTLLDSLPRSVQLRGPYSGRTETATLSRDALVSTVRSPLYAPALAAALPRAISEAAAGRFEALAGLNAVVVGRPGRKSGASLAAGMHFSVVCAEDMPRLAQSTDAPGRDFGTGARGLYEQVCADWPRGEVPAAFYSVGPSRAPVLLLSGGLDPVTPPRHGERIARALGPLASHRVVPNAGHGLLATGCVRDLVFRFIDAPDTDRALAASSSCVEGLPRPPAWLPPVNGGGA